MDAGASGHADRLAVPCPLHAAWHVVSAAPDRVHPAGPRAPGGGTGQEHDRHLAGCDLSEASRLAAATGAYLCFEDEAGQALRPPKARTWARRGRIPGGRGVREGLRAGVSCRPDLLQAWCAQPVLLPDPRAHRPERRAPVHVRSRLRRPGHRRAQPAPCPADPGSTRMGVHDLAATQNWKIWCDVPNVSANLDNRK